MADTKDSGGVDQKAASGDADGADAKTQDTSQDTVKYETLRKLLNEKKAVDAKYEALAKEMADGKAAREADEEARLTESKSFKGLLELKDKKVKEYVDALKAKEDENKELKKTFQNALKLDAVVKAASATIKSKFYGHIDLDKIELDANGKPDPTSVKQVVQLFESEYPECLDRGDKIQLPNGAAAKPNGGVLPTVEEFNRLPLKDKYKVLPEMIAAGKLT